MAHQVELTVDWPSPELRRYVENASTEASICVLPRHRALQGGLVFLDLDEALVTLAQSNDVTLGVASSPDDEPSRAAEFGSGAWLEFALALGANLTSNSIAAMARALRALYARHRSLANARGVDAPALGLGIVDLVDLTNPRVLRYGGDQAVEVFVRLAEEILRNRSTENNGEEAPSDQDARPSGSADHAKLLRDVVDIFSVVVDPEFVPEANSPAAVELRFAREEEAANGSWGEGPVRMAYGVAAMCYHASLLQANAMATLMTEPYSELSVAVLARSVAESASQAWWLLEPGIDCVRRVCRLQALRFRSAVEGERAMKADGVPVERYHEFIETTAEVEEYSRQLGLECPSSDGSVYVCEGERLPTASRRVEALFADVDVPSVYKLYSGAPHGELYALKRGFTISPDESGHVVAVPLVNEEIHKGALAVAAWALQQAGGRFTLMFGVDVANRREDIVNHLEGESIEEPPLCPRNGPKAGHVAQSQALEYLEKLRNETVHGTRTEDG